MSTISGRNRATTAFVFSAPWIAMHPEQVAEEVRTRVAHEAGRGRKAVAEEAERRAGGQRGEHAGGVAVERERDDRQGSRRDHADARGQAVHPVGQVDDVHDRDDPEDGEDLAQVDRPDEVDARRIDAAEERQA